MMGSKIFNYVFKIFNAYLTKGFITMFAQSNFSDFEKHKKKTITLFIFFNDA